MDDLADNLLPQRCLVCAIVAQAIRDSQRNDREALLFLDSREVEEWCFGWGVDIERVKKIVNSNVVKRIKVV